MWKNGQLRQLNRMMFTQWFWQYGNCSTYRNKEKIVNKSFDNTNSLDILSLFLYTCFLYNVFKENNFIIIYYLLQSL